MSNNPAIDVAIGLLLMYLLLSLIVTVINEVIAAAVDLRAANLKDALTDVLDNETLRRDFYDHGLVSSVNQAVATAKGPFAPFIAWFYRLITRTPNPNNDPHVSYLSSKNFALALLGSLDPTKPIPAFETVKTSIEHLPDSNIRDVLLANLATAEGDFGKLQDNVAKWFDSAMDRVSGGYNRQLKRISFFVGLALVLTVNADTVNVAQSLWKNSALRLEMVQLADSIRTNPPPEAAKAHPVSPGGESPASPVKLGPAVEAIQGDVAELKQLPVGWTSFSSGTAPLSEISLNVLLKIIGLVLTALAISLGAPFWFDLLNMFMNLRATGEKPVKAAAADAGDTN